MLCRKPFVDRLDKSSLLEYDEEKFGSAPSASPRKKSFFLLKHVPLAFGFLVIFFLFVFASHPHKSLFFFSVTNRRSDNDANFRPPVSSFLSSYAQLCSYKAAQPAFAEPGDRVNQRAPTANASCTIIKNANILHHGASTPVHATLVLRNGLVFKLSPDENFVNACAGVRAALTSVIDADGRIVTPGLVDMHSHAGLNPWPSLRGSDDVNEVGNPTVPYLSVLDAFDNKDEGLRLILAGGITSSLVVPGSANLMGGEGFVFKTAMPKSGLPEDMLLQAGLSESTSHQTGAPFRRWMKMACGENPLRVYSASYTQRRTRMGNAYLVKKQMEEASQLKAEINDWCDEGEKTIQKCSKEWKGNVNHNCVESKLSSIKQPNLPMEKEILVALLRGKVGIHWHCYLVNDVTTQLRIARQYNFSISAFHHALDIVNALPALKRWNEEGREEIGAAIFADNWAYKREAYFASIHTGERLVEKNITFAYKSDHPVLNSQFLAHQAGRAVSYGLPRGEALRTITESPAKLLKLSHRIGSLDDGMDADVVIWNTRRDIFQIGALPWRVFVDGELALHNNNSLAVIVDEKTEATNAAVKLVPISATVEKGHKYKIFYNVEKIIDGNNSIQGPVHIVVDIVAGRFKHIERNLKIIKSFENANVAAVFSYDVSGGVMTPQLTSLATILGVREISQEPETGDIGESEYSGFEGIPISSDSLISNSKLLESAVQGGIGHVVCILPTDQKASRNGVIPVFASLYSISNGSEWRMPTIIEKKLAYYVDLAVEADSGISFAHLMVKLRLRIHEWQATEDPKIKKIPLLVRVDMASHIMTLISVVAETKKEICKKSPTDCPTFPLVIAGAAEIAQVSAEWFKKTKIAVIFNDARCAPSIWRKRKCQTVLDEMMHAAQYLKSINVPFAVSTAPEEPQLVHNLRFEANWVRKLARLNDMDSVDFVSKQALRVLGIDPNSLYSFEAQGLARFNIWSGDPGEINTQLLYSFNP